MKLSVEKELTFIEDETFLETAYECSEQLDLLADPDDPRDLFGMLMRANESFVVPIQTQATRSVADC